MWKSINERAAALAGSRWSHVVIFVGACLNTFIPLFSGPLSVLFCALVAAAPTRRWRVALTNAAGATCGMALLFYCIRTAGGGEWIAETFPKIGAALAAASVDDANSIDNASGGGTHEWIRSGIADYGGVAIFAACTLPVMIQPLAVVASVAGFEVGTFAVAVFFGRFIKYAVMAQLACSAPHYVRYLGGGSGGSSATAPALSSSSSSPQPQGQAQHQQGSEAARTTVRTPLRDR